MSTSTGDRPRHDDGRFREFRRGVPQETLAGDTPPVHPRPAPPADLYDAQDLLRRLRAGRAVRLWTDGDRMIEVTVQEELRRPDGFGSWDQEARVKLGFGPGRYNTEVSPAALVSGRFAVEPVPPPVPSADELRQAVREWAALPNNHRDGAALLTYVPDGERPSRELLDAVAELTGKPVDFTNVTPAGVAAAVRTHTKRWAVQQPGWVPVDAEAVRDRIVAREVTAKVRGG